MGIIDKLFGGGQKAAGKALGEGYQQAEQYQKPFYEGGTKAFDKLQTGYGEMEDPNAFYNKIGSQYEPSSNFQFQLKKIMDVINNNAIKTGRLGSDSQDRDIADYTHEMLGTDFQTFLQNILGINNNYLGGEEKIANYGVNAGNNLGNLKIGQGQAKAQEKMGEAAGYKGLMTTLINTAANIATGGMSGVAQAGMGALSGSGGGFDWGAGLNAAIRPYSAVGQRDNGGNNQQLQQLLQALMSKAE